MIAAKLQSPVSVALVGCGALAELYYAPALAELQRGGRVNVVGLFDPNPASVAKLQKLFPSARAVGAVGDLCGMRPSIGIVASPAKFHAEQTIALLNSGINVLCEKPMASTVAEAEAMNAAALRNNRLLAVGLFRRFFPALQTIRSMVAQGTFGLVRSFTFFEGGPFNWPAASPSFFHKAQAHGGVLLDLGIHVLDLVDWLFGAPSEIRCADDAMGNLEANCTITLKFPAGQVGEIRLSRDTVTENQFTIHFDRGVVRWQVGDANHLRVQFAGVPGELRSEMWETVTGTPVKPRLAASYHQSFVHQLLNVIAAVRGEGNLMVGGEQGIRSLRHVERCYQQRTLMPMPWLTPRELEQAQALSGLS